MHGMEAILDIFLEGTDMASEWFYQVMGEQVGPVPSTQLRNLAQRGTITIETPVANAANGPWVPAGRVKGLFALPNRMPPSAAVQTHPQATSADAAIPDESSGLGTATKIALGAGCGVCTIVLGFLVWFIAARDTWELHNADRVSAKLEEADRLQQSDFVTAYKTYDEALNEAKQHKITDSQFAQKLANAETSRTALYARVKEKIRADEVEKQRQAEKEARRVAAEKQPVAAKKAHGLEKQERIADEKPAIVESKPKPAYLTLSLDLSTQRLPHSFLGHDPRAIYEIVAARFGPKSEFETTQQYKERLRLKKEKPLFGDVSVSDILGSTTDHSNDNSTGTAEMVYDADHQVFRVTAWMSEVETDPLVSTERETRQAITVRAVREYKGSYVGENAYGAKTDIVKVDQNIYCLIFNNPEDFGIARESSLTKIMLAVNMDVARAKVAKRNLRTLLLYRLVNPFSQEKKDHIYPKIDNPRDGEFNHYYLNAKVEAIWLYDFESGEIYSKINARN